jgi:anti-sigma regulatory factor (Ser/Thr protein kinase)
MGEAREYVRGRLAEALAPSKLWDVELLTSELVSNAVQHVGTGEGEAAIGLEIDIRPHAIRVSVTDEGGGFIPMQREPDQEIGGWGLSLVETVSDRWGIQDRPFTVWFEIDR